MYKLAEQKLNFHLSFDPCNVVQMDPPSVSIVEMELKLRDYLPAGSSEVDAGNSSGNSIKYLFSLCAVQIKANNYRLYIR